MLPERLQDKKTAITKRQLPSCRTMWLIGQPACIRKQGYNAQCIYPASVYQSSSELGRACLHVLVRRYKQENVRNLVKEWDFAEGTDTQHYPDFFAISLSPTQGCSKMKVHMPIRMRPTSWSALKIAVQLRPTGRVDSVWDRRSMEILACTLRTWAAPQYLSNRDIHLHVNVINIGSLSLNIIATHATCTLVTPTLTTNQVERIRYRTATYSRSTLSKALLPVSYG